MSFVLVASVVTRSNNPDRLPYINSPLIVTVFQGMKYLHNTAVKFHGNLTSTRCVIDSHWVVKITDWGLHEFKAEQENTKKHPNKMYAGTFTLCSLGRYVYYNSSFYQWEVKCPNI